MENQESIVSQCHRIIAAWQLDYSQLFEFLQSERAAMQERDFGLLAKITSEKHSLLDRIVHNQSIDGDNTAAAHTQLKELAASNPELQTDWLRMAELASECQQLNEVNGKMLVMLTEANRRTLNIFKGLNPDNNIYDNKGARHFVSNGRNAVAV